MQSYLVTDFDEFIRRVRQGDREAAEQLVRHFEPEIRVEVRHWLRFRDPRLRRVFDSMDICQSVLSDFFARSALGDFDLSDPSHLVRLLVGMTSNKVAERVRHYQRSKRDVRAVMPLDVGAMNPSTTADAPDRIAAARELLSRCRGLLDATERRLADMRSNGEDWKTIAATVGGTADARRKQFHRAINRIIAHLGGDPTQE